MSQNCPCLYPAVRSMTLHRGRASGTIRAPCLGVTGHRHLCVVRRRNSKAHLKSPRPSHRKWLPEHGWSQPGRQDELRELWVGGVTRAQGPSVLPFQPDSGSLTPPLLTATWQGSGPSHRRAPHHDHRAGGGNRMHLTVGHGAASVPTASRGPSGVSGGPTPGHTVLPGWELAFARGWPCTRHKPWHDLLPTPSCSENSEECYSVPKAQILLPGSDRSWWQPEVAPGEQPDSLGIRCLTRRSGFSCQVTTT